MKGPSPLLHLSVEPRRELETYKSALRSTFAFLKATRRFDELLVRSIRLPEDGGYLVPVCEIHASDPSAIERLSDWRAAAASAFPTQFQVTHERTAAWLRDRLINVEDRILFFVLDPVGHPIGHLGFANGLNDEADLEVDNVVRGVAGSSPGAMRSAMRALLQWARETIGPASFSLRVFSDNERAIQFYRDVGFVDCDLVPLRRQEERGTVTFEPIQAAGDADADRYFLRMRYAGDGPWQPGKMLLTAGPSISAREASYVWHAAREGWNEHWANYLDRFESGFADYLGMRHALAFSSCTGALHLALLALGVGPGDEVIVPEITWVASASAVAYTGATPVFADVQPDSWCLAPESFEAAITPRTKAVIPVHLYGHPAEMDRIMDIASRYAIRVVEDAAPAIGAEYRGRRVGTFGDFAAFSFQGAKLLVTGEGGMLVTDSEELYGRVRTIWDQGRVPGTFWIGELGWKYKMSNLQAALGLAQLERVAELIEAKRRIFRWYEQGLAGVRGVKLNRETAGSRSIYWMTSIILDEQSGIGRDALREKLRLRKVDTRPVFPAISQYPVWRGRAAAMPTGAAIAATALNLPSGVCLTREQVAYVCDCIREEVGCGA